MSERKIRRRGKRMRGIIDNYEGEGNTNEKRKEVEDVKRNKKDMTRKKKKVKKE